MATKSHFNIVQQFTADFCPSKVTLYESGRTGLRAVVVDRKGPKVNGYFAVATEIHDDSGAPHTLEHLVFMGSKSYRYKGLLDKLATRAYSNTNAWTATDQTVYTLDTAGWDGFAQILPVYLEHVLLPTMTDAACYTEVHHVDGEGNDAGVVYSEMQGVQNQSSELMELQARRLLYPENVGFRFETGGLMERLRVLTTDRIRRFHKQMYQPKNMCVLVMGEVDHSDLLNVLDKFEDGILEDVPKLDDSFARPWTQSVRTPALAKSIRNVVEFPEDDESMGEILVGYLGPDCNNSVQVAAINVLLTYICGSSISVLENTIVEREQLASAVYYSADTRPDIVIWFTLSGVLTTKLETVEQRFFDVLEEAASQPMDMPYLNDCLHRYRRQLVFDSENSSTFFEDDIIKDHLFGKRDGSQLVELATLREYDELATWNEESWKEFFSKWIAKANHVSILGKPSRKMSQRLKKDEKARVKAQRERLGPDGLKGLQDKLDAAKAENDREIPADLLDQFKIPSTDSIHFIPTTTARSGLAKKMGELDNAIQHKIDHDKTGLPIFIHFEHIPSSFVRVEVIINTHSIPVEFRPLLNIYLSSFFELPIQRNGRRIEFEEIVKQLEKDTIDYSIDSAAGLSNPELLRIRMKIEPTKYETAIAWIRDLLAHSIFDVTRLVSTVAKLLADIPEQKRNGNTMLSAVVSMVHLNKVSSSRARGTLVNALYLRRIRGLLKRSPQTVIDKLETLRKALVTFSNMRVFVTANLENDTLANPVSAWNSLTSIFDTSNPDPEIAPLDSQMACLSPAGVKPGSLAYIVPLHTIDSSYAALIARGPDSYTHPKLPALSVALAYLDAVEGPLWVAVRGTGLAYGTGFTRDVDIGMIRFGIYRSPDAYRAYIASKKAVEDIASGAVPLDDFTMEGAISSIVVAFADEQPTMGSAAAVSFANQVVRGVEKDFATGFMKSVGSVTKEQVREVLQEFVVPVFSPKSADLVVTCSMIMKEGLEKGFGEAGFEVQVRELASFQDDYGLEGSADDAGDEEEGSDGEDDDDGEGEGEDEEQDGDDDGDDDGEDEDEDDSADVEMTPEESEEEEGNGTAIKR